MLKARKGNRVTRIADERKREYIAKGYRITDMTDVVIYDPVYNNEDVKALQERAAANDAEIDALKAENLELRAQIAQMAAGGKGRKVIKKAAETAEENE